MSHVTPAVILYESKIPDIETGLASADRRIDAARADAPDPGRDHPGNRGRNYLGMVGDIIPEWWAASTGIRTPPISASCVGGRSCVALTSQHPAPAMPRPAVPRSRQGT